MDEGKIMLLKIENLGKINNASIEMNGITVIAGDNNTGKSTIGKALFAIFNALYNSDEKIKDLRIEELGKIFSVYMKIILMKIKVH